MPLPSGFKIDNQPNKYSVPTDFVLDEPEVEQPSYAAPKDFILDEVIESAPSFKQGQPPTMLERGKEAVTDFFRRDPGLGPLTEEDYAAFEPADVSIPGEPAAEPTTPDIPISDIEGQLPLVESIDPTLAMTGLTPEEAAMGRPVSTITGKPIPTPEEEAAGGKAAMAIIPYGFASAVRGMVPGALERAVMDPITKAVVGKEYVSPIDEALKIGKYLPEEAQMAIGAPAHMAGAIVPLSISFKTSGAIMKAVGLPPDLVLRTGPVMDRITAHVARGGIAGAVYGGLEAGTPKGMAEDAAFFGALEGGLGAVGGIFRKLFSSNWYRNLEVPERGLVVQSADDLLKAGHSEGTILRTLSDPVERGRLLEEAARKRMVPEEPAAPGLSETQRDLAKEVIREEMAKAPPSPVIPEEPIPTVSPMEIVPGVPPVMPAPVAELPSPGWEVIKEGRGVEVMVKPELAPEIPSAPEEPIVEHKPILSTRGLPWKEEKNALSALRSREDVSPATHKVVKVKKGYGIVPFADKRARVEAEAKPEKVKGKTLIAFVRAMGGIKDKTLPGEIRALSPKETGVVGLTTSIPDKGLGFDEMASAAVEYGWLPENLEDESGAFSELLRDDIFAQKEKKPRVERLADVAEKAEREERWKEFERAEDAELEYFAKHPDEEIDADLDEWQREAVAEIRSRNEADRARKIEKNIASKVEAKNPDLGRLKKDEGFPEYIKGWDEKDLLDEEALAELAAWRAGEEAKKPVVPNMPKFPKGDFDNEIKALNQYLAEHDPKKGRVPAKKPYLETRDEKFAKIVGDVDTQASNIADGVEDVRQAIWIGEKLGYYSDDIAKYLEQNYVEGVPDGGKIISQIERPEKRPGVPEKKAERPTEPAMSPELKELHDHKARTLGFEKAGGSFVEGYLKRLAKVAEKTDMPAAMAAYEALSEYKKGNIEQASLEAEKVLGKLHKAEKEALMPRPKEPVAEAPAKEPWEMTQDKWIDGHIKSSAMHREHVRQALKSGKLIPENYKKLHERDYGPLAEFMPEVVEKPKPKVAPKPEKEPVLREPEVPYDVQIKEPEIKTAILRDILGGPELRATLDYKRKGYGKPYEYYVESSSNLGRDEFVFKTFEEGLRWAEKHGFRAEILKDIAGIKKAYLIHRKTSKLLEQQAKIIDERWNSGKDVFVRYGRIPKSGKSANNITGGFEKGVSVFRGRLLPDGNILISPESHVDEATFHVLSRSGRKIYVVTGKEIGIGADGEPLLANAKQLTKSQAVKKMFSRSEIKAYAAKKPTLGEPEPRYLVAEPTEKYRQSELDLAFGGKEKADEAIESVAKEVDKVSRRGMSDRVAREPAKSKVAEEMRKNKRVDLTGRKLTTENESQEIAELFQVYRSPKMEILHAIYTSKDGVILGHNALTSGNMGAVSPTNVAKYIYKMQSAAKRLGATKVHILHNHPSGNPTMSQADINFANALHEQPTPKRNALGDLMGEFIVIDHGKFTWVSHYFKSGEIHVDEGKFKVTPGTGEWMLKKGPQMTGPKAVAAFGQNLAYDKLKACFVYVDGGNNIQGWSTHDKKILEKSVPELKKILRQQAKAYDSSKVVILSDDMTLLEPIARYGNVGDWLLDALDTKGNSLREIVPAGFKVIREPTKPAWGLFEPEAPYAEEPISETKARLLANIKSEKGSSELINDLSRLGADIMKRGHTTYKAFTTEMKTELSSVWEKIKSLIRKAYFAAKKIIKSERGAVEIKKPKKPWLTKSQKERRAKKKAIKEKQLKIENAKEAKEQIHGMIRDRRQNLNLSAYETNLFINDIEQQTTKIQREIIPFIIEKTDIPESLNRPDLEKVYKKDKDNLVSIALQVKQHFDAGWLKMKENIPDMSAEQVENYVTHIWDLDKGQKRIVTNWFITQNRFLKKRYIETLKEGIEELGLTPKVLDISEIIRIHDGVASRAIENVKFVEGLKNLKYEGMPLIARADLAPQNWVYFDHPALRRGLVIPGKLKMGEKVSPELSSLLEEMGVAIGRRISPVAWGKPVGKAGEYISGEPPEVRFQRFMSSRTIAHEIGHHLDEVLGLGYKFLNNYASELYAINRERIESRTGEVGKYGEAYVKSAEEQIAEFFATLFTDASKAYRIAPNATADALNRLKQDEVLSKLIDFDFEKRAKNLIEEQVSTLVKLPIKVHPDLEKPLKVIFESRIDHPVIQAYEVANGVLKKTNLSLSLFHHGALGETGIAIMGPGKVLNIYFNPVKIYKAMVQGKFDVFEKEPIARRWIGAGLQVGATADVPVNMIQSKLNNLARKTKNVPLINKTTEFIRTFNEVWDKALWNYLHDTLKLYACESLGTKIDLTKDITKQEQEITQFVNDTFGGQNWDTLMVSPKSLQIMTWSLLSADWTTSTVRQALSPTGIGRAHKETVGLRRKLGAYFWIKAGLYFGAGINMLNYTFREWDEKEHPEYYKGMGKRTFLDKTMAGNTMGHKTHLFVGRYEDGTERYIRWGKQFRELPELFFDDTGFSPISATFKKVGGKLAPMIQLTSKITTGTSPSGFRDDDIYGKKGWDRVYGMGKVLIKSPLPFATRTLFQEGKEFHVTDLAMPSSKGMTRWKSINLFKHAIIKKDDQLLKETYQFTLMNNLSAYTLFSTALTILKAENTKEFNEGIKTKEDVKKKLEDVAKRIGEINSKKIDKLENLIRLKNDLEKDLTRLDNKYKRVQRENTDRKLGMDLLDQAIIDIKKYEIIENK